MACLTDPKDPNPCNTCGTDLTPENTHLIIKNTCNACWGRKMCAAKYAKLEEKDTRDAEHAKNQILFGPYYNTPRCETCQNSIHPGMFFKMNVSLCKHCYIKLDTKKNPPETRKCQECKVEVSVDDFYPTNQSKSERTQWIKRCCSATSLG